MPNKPLKSFAELQAILYPEKATSRKQKEESLAWKQHEIIQRLLPPEQTLIDLGERDEINVSI